MPLRDGKGCGEIECVGEIFVSRILHFGVGNFSRAHQFWYTQNAGENWRITGVSLRRPDIRDNLNGQDFDYTLAIYGPESADFNRITVLDDILVAPESPQEVLAAIADPAVTIITITVTEKGYAVDPSSGALDPHDRQIKEDLSSGNPSSLLGYLVHGLATRAKNDAGPITILSCDNLSGNGDILKCGVSGFAEKAGIDITGYLDKSVCFPNTMVDRITPATTEDLKATVFKKTDWADQAPVATEQFSEWIIEDRFCSAHPAWDRAGAQFVKDVTPYELRKLRLLNGPHSLLAYFGQIRGYEFVHEAVADPEILSHVRGLMGEATATLPEPIKSESSDYCDALIERFSNPALRHSLKQIAMDGTEKLPIRILPVLKMNAENGTEARFARHAVACWLAFALRQSAQGIFVDDPKAKEISDVCRKANNVLDGVRALLELLDPKIAGDPEGDAIASDAVQLAAI